MLFIVFYHFKDVLHSNFSRKSLKIINLLLCICWFKLKGKKVFEEVLIINDKLLVQLMTIDESLIRKVLPLMGASR